MDRNDEPTSNMKNLHYDAKGNLQKGNKSRIEEIKKRAKIVDNLNDDRADVNYLLSKLEIAQNGLEKILSEKGPRLWRDKHLAPIYREIAMIALQQIRE